jgi:hypothetical protein
MTRHRSNTAGKEGVKHKMRIKKGLAALLLLLDEWDEAEDGLLETLLRKRLETTTMKKDAAKNRKLRQRTSWSRFQSRLTDKQFRRYFRMERECFEYLCQRGSLWFGWRQSIFPFGELHRRGSLEAS